MCLALIKWCIAFIILKFMCLNGIMCHDNKSLTFFLLHSLRFIGSGGKKAASFVSAAFEIYSVELQPQLAFFTRLLFQQSEPFGIEFTAFE